jgi:hypothetical protein
MVNLPRVERELFWFTTTAKAVPAIAKVGFAGSAKAPTQSIPRFFNRILIGD